MEITEFKKVVDNYDVVFFDAFGVLKNSSGMIPHIEKTFEYLIRKKIDFYILTNDASKGPKSLAQSYIDAGFTMINEEKIISSGMLAREYLRMKVKDGKVAYLGTKQSAHYLEETGLKALSIADLDLNKIDDVNALVFLDDEGFDWREDLNKLVNLLRLRNIPVMVANTDKSYPVSDRMVAIAVGSIADMVENITGRKFIKFGKPDSSMFIFAYEHTLSTREIDKERVLMVGDTLFTDIIGGNKFGIDTALVLTGNTLKEHYEERIKAMGIIPDFVCPSAVVY
ncbi:HAD-IIA family hydrolase [Gilvimarinus agarilyticus]|uniref:HAD-superfamily class IIA hydrolase, TIGR01459 n=1 Tax=Reichenbachiella agariperforans TaxID=156994 RepID=A0A1M6MZT4_REIAG|nr:MULTISPECIES: HAD-IIA family hydrolase [Reichenbachiella]MBU2887990.1 HAD-IIA family hydrolase [Gilvimarinus agarilyticus]MBU2915659.1 HAD-IIA family hydrolase [Reichenbachiella agariperforans]RJE72066.1 haloacid dehalogenase [Reichenbachiella sp. MSK19-1]SHJ88989.1 HAD-superfamily class IIA hydrolase, TIGR01459 [Reichenbachiella agariperforans]